MIWKLSPSPFSTGKPGDFYGGWALWIFRWLCQVFSERGRGDVKTCFLLHQLVGWLVTVGDGWYCQWQPHVTYKLVESSWLAFPSHPASSWWSNSGIQQLLHSHDISRHRAHQPRWGYISNTVRYGHVNLIRTPRTLVCFPSSKEHGLGFLGGTTIYIIPSLLVAILYS